MQSQKSRKNRIMIECAVMIALASVLSLFKIWEAPLGGAVTVFSMVPIIIIGLRHGPTWGFCTAYVYSFTQLLLGLGSFAYIPTVTGTVFSVLFDYIIAFTIIGAAGFFKSAVEKYPTRGKKIIFASIATLIACILRYICHFISGVVVWYEITKAGDWNEYVHTVGAFVYSTVYNATYMIPETIITLVAAPAIVTILSAIGKKKNDPL